MTNFKTKVSKFRVPIAVTPLWKIEAISKYKTQLVKKSSKSPGNGTNNIIEKSCSANNGNNNNNNKNNNNNNRIDGGKATTNHSENVSNVVQKDENLSEATTHKKVMINNVNVIDFTKFNEINEIHGSSDIQAMDIDAATSQLNITVEQIETELQNLVKNSELVKKEVSCLNNVRCALLWLLKKTTNYDTYRNHSLI